MQRLYTLAILFTCAFFITGCENFAHPLSTKEDSLYDNRLVGYWKIVGKDATQDQFDQHITYIADTNSYDIVDAKNNREPACEYRATQIGENYFLSVGGKNPETNEEVWMLLRYKFSSLDELHIYSIDSEKLLQAVQSGKLSGKLKKHEPRPLAKILLGVKGSIQVERVTSTREEVRTFLEQQPDAIFNMETPYIYRRVTPEKEKEQNKECKESKGIK